MFLGLLLLLGFVEVTVEVLVFLWADDEGEYFEGILLVVDWGRFLYRFLRNGSFFMFILIFLNFVGFRSHLLILDMIARGEMLVSHRPHDIQIEYVTILMMDILIGPLESFLSLSEHID